MAKPFEIDKSYTMVVKGFTYIKAYAFLVFEGGKVLLGSQSEFPMKQLMQLKGCSVDVTYKGTKNINGTDYDQFKLDCVAF